MTTQQSLHSQVTQELIPENQRMIVTGKLFGMRFPLVLEATVFSFADRLSEDYKGGYWDFFMIDRGFYMAPADDRSYHVISDNTFEADLSKNTFGIVVCLHAYSHLSFISTTAFLDTYADHYHRLLEYAMHQADVNLILRIID